MELIKAGKIVNTHGIRGDIKIDVWMNDARDLCDIPTLYIDGKPFAVTAARAQRAVAIVHLKGIDTIEMAETMKGREISIEKTDDLLDEGEYFIEDIIGCEVFDVDTDEHYGVIVDVYPGIANDAYEIRLKSGKQVLFPVIKEVIIDTDIEAKTIKIRPLGGMFEI